MRNRWFITLALLVSLSLMACQPIQVPVQEQIAPQGAKRAPRPDAPPYAVHGPFAVVARDFVIGEGDDAIQMTVWYPALNPTHAKEKITYQLSEKVASIPPLSAAERISFGMALQDATPDRAQAPYPLVVFSVGLAGFRQQNSYLPEHLASYGMVVLSGDPRGETLFEEFWAGAATRQIDAKRMIAFADELTAPGGEWAGLIDTEHIATAGHSSGGWSALAGGGAQMDFSWCTVYHPMAQLRAAPRPQPRKTAHRRERNAALWTRSASVSCERQVHCTFAGSLLGVG
jgi:predicted dienelactone hydrolase